jgi:hypothetical protein
MFKVGRPKYGCYLNGIEYLLKDGKAMDFDTKEDAIKYLRKKGFTAEDILSMEFVKEKSRILTAMR